MRLRVLTLNVWGLPLGLARHHDARMVAIGEGFAGSGADVIALQEVWTSAARAVLAEAGRRAGYAALWHRPAVLGGSGLMVLSRLPITRRHFTRFRLAGLPQRPQHGDFYGGKGFASLELASGVGPVTFIDTHLHAGYTKPDANDEYRGIRAAQAIELAAHVRGLQTPVVAAGDFNTQEGADAYAILLGLGGFRDLAVALDRRQATSLSPHPYRGRSPEARIDLVLARGGQALSIRPVAIERVFDEDRVFDGEPGAYSDHAGLLAEIDLEPRALPAAPLAWPAPDPQVLELAERELQRGVRRALARRRRELLQAGGGIAGGLLLGAAARSARQRRRGFLLGAATGLAGLGVLGGLGAAGGSHWVTENEVAGFAEVQGILIRLRAERTTSGRLGAP